MSEVLSDRGLLEVETLPFWTGPIKIWPLQGGITNRNYGVMQSDGQRFAVRLGQDIPEHGVMRFNEQAAAKAAAKAGISPKIYYTAPGVMVSRLLPGRSLTADEIMRPENLTRIAALVKRCHTSMLGFLHGPLLAFWVFHINRSYGATLVKSRSRLAQDMNRLMAINDALEQRVGKVDVSFCHNDLLAANIFDDGARLWLLDWDYAGFNAPLFDLANLSSNNGLFVNNDATLLEAYFGGPPDPSVYGVFESFKCASLLRETLWGAVSEISSTVNFDYQSYTNDYRERFETALAELG